MADPKEDKAPEPKAVTYKEVSKAYPEGADETWRKIGDITGAGHVPLNADGDASIDTTGLADGKQKAIDALLKPQKEGKA
jgi:hypothetical protein